MNEWMQQNPGYAVIVQIVALCVIYCFLTYTYNAVVDIARSILQYKHERDKAKAIAKEDAKEAKKHHMRNFEVTLITPLPNGGFCIGSVLLYAEKLDAKGLDSAKAEFQKKYNPFREPNILSVIELED